MKKIISTLLLAMILMSIGVYSFASTEPNVSDYIRLNSGTKEDILINEQNKKKAELEAATTLLPMATSTRTLNVPTYQQETSYWCGPANIKQVIQYINGSSQSQSTYASDMGTNSSDGTYVYRMTNELNAKQSTFTYAHYQMSSSDKQSLALGISISIGQGKPCIFHARTEHLYMYNGKALGHYITGRGYSFSGFETASIDADTNALDGTVYYTDPYSSNQGRGNTLGNHSDSLTNIANSLNGRYLIR